MEIEKKHLDLTFYSVDLEREISFRQYFEKLLLTLWEENEGFSGKRPFGNSSWEYDLYIGLIKNNLVEGALDKDGCVDELDTDEAYSVIYTMIQFMCRKEN